MDYPGQRRIFLLEFGENEDMYILSCKRSYVCTMFKINKKILISLDRYFRYIVISFLTLEILLTNIHLVITITELYIQKVILAELLTKNINCQTPMGCSHTLTGT